MHETNAKTVLQLTGATSRRRLRGAERLFITLHDDKRHDSYFPGIKESIPQQTLAGNLLAHLCYD